MNPSTKDQIEGTMHEVKGKVKETAGQVANNPDLESEGQVENLGGKIQSPQRHAEQEPQPGHDAVAVADARARLGKMQLEPADVLCRGRVGGPLEKRGEPLAAVNVAPLRTRTKLASVHVLDHALA